MHIPGVIETRKKVGINRLSKVKSINWGDILKNVYTINLLACGTFNAEDYLKTSWLMLNWLMLSFLMLE